MCRSPRSVNKENVAANRTVLLLKTSRTTRPYRAIVWPHPTVTNMKSLPKTGPGFYARAYLE